MDSQAKSFSPHKYQQYALDSKHRFIACISGIQGGKTTVGALWLINEIYQSYQRGERGDWLIVAPTIKILEQSTLPKFQEWFPQDWGTYKEQRKCFDLAWGNKIYVRSGDEPDYLEGMTVRGAWLDEAGQLGLDAWVNIQGRLSIHQGRAFITTTPYTQVWLKREFMTGSQHVFLSATCSDSGKELTVEYKDRDNDRLLVGWTSLDNPAFPKAEFDRVRKEISPESFQRRYLGKWSTKEGLVYKNFSHSQHVIKPFVIPSDWVKFAGIDFGNTNPTAILSIARRPEVKDKAGTVVEPSQYYVYREFYKTTPLLVEISTFLQAEGFKFVLGDPSGAQQMDEIKRFHKFRNIETAENKIEIGVDRIYKLLGDNRLFFFEGRTPNTLREIQEYHYAAPNEDKPIKDVPVAVNNHAMDAMRYAFSKEMKHIFVNRVNKYQQRGLVFGRKLATPDVTDSYTGYF